MQLTETDGLWEQVAPHLESALARLRAKDRWVKALEEALPVDLISLVLSR